MAASVSSIALPAALLDGQEPSLFEWLKILWTRRWMILAFSVFCALSAATVAWLLPKKYEATILISPVTTRAGSAGLGSQESAVARLGGLSSIVGLSGGGGAGVKAESLATLQSEALTRRYIQENNLLPVLFSERWDSRAMKWNSEASDRVPTLWKGNEFFSKKVRSVSENAKTGLVTMTITWTDPKLAAQWANGLVDLTNVYLCEKAIQTSERNIEYLIDQASKTTVVALRDAIYKLMEEEIKEQMIARGNSEYALQVIDPAVVPERYASPRPLIWGSMGLVAGIFLSASAVVIRMRLLL